MGILCKGGHISAAVYKQRSTWHVSQLIGRKRRQENFTIQRQCHLVSEFVLCCLSFIFSFPNQWLGLPTLAQDFSTSFQTATLKPEKDILLAVSGPSKLAQTWEVRTDEILI